MVCKQWILHDWTDDECVKILKNCKEAIASKGEGGKLIIIDMVLEDDVEGNKNNKSVENQILVDMLLIVLYPGKERTEKELTNLFHSAGFSHYKIHPVLGSRSLIEVFP